MSASVREITAWESETARGEAVTGTRHQNLSPEKPGQVSCTQNHQRFVQLDDRNSNDAKSPGSNRSHDKISRGTAEATPASE